MDYFSIINLTAEPFSNSPDPAFFFQSRQHRAALQKLELALRLRRGLNVVIGEVGTGKTTLCRQLIRRFGDDPGIETHLILDPSFDGPAEFIGTLCGFLTGKQEVGDQRLLKEHLKQTLFHKGVEENKTVVLIIDEGQKLAPFCLEILRECLNYETNTFKLLQIVIFAQEEFQALLDDRVNFADRINLFHRLGPLSFGDTRRLIRFRLQQASDLKQVPTTQRLFTVGALWAIHRASSGYPRQIIHLCHQCLLALIIQDKTRVGWSLARGCARRTRPPERRKPLAPAMGVLAALAVAVGLWVAVQSPLWRQWVGLLPQSPTSPGRQSAPAVIANPIVPPAPAEAASVAQTAAQASAVVAAADTDPSEVALVNPADKPFNAPADSSQAAGLPESLGDVTVGPEEMLSWLMVKIYGNYGPGHLKRLREANGHLGNPDRVPSGTVLRFPARPVTVGTNHRPLWWIRVGQVNRLDEAVELVRRYPHQAPPARIIGHWHRSEGLSFSIILWRSNKSEAMALQRIAQLPLPLSSQAQVVAAWDPDTVFFADPYAGGSD